MANATEGRGDDRVTVRVGSGSEGQKLWIHYDVLGWATRVEADARQPFDGPSRIVVQLDMGDDGVDEAVEAAEGSGGITAEVLRSVPLGDARKELRRLRAQYLADADREDRAVYDLPDRMSDPLSWARFAEAYARAATRNPAQPRVHLAQATGLSVNTIAARLRRAQELGFLEATTDEAEPWLVLTSAARKVLDERKGE